MERPCERLLLRAALAIIALAGASARAADELKVGDPAPLFTAKTHDGSDFDLASRKGQWTVLYFYPKAGTPGCTKQADAFRDNIKAIRDQGAEVYGISTDSVEAQADFHKEQQLVFILLADPDGVVTEQYGAKMPVLTLAKRWTFIIGPDLTIPSGAARRRPTMDAQRVAAEIQRLKGSAAPPYILTASA
jgi:peroxiredoxin Q/BCP